MNTRCGVPAASSTTGLALASALDRDYFTAHPARRGYQRPSIPGEFGAQFRLSVGTYVVVTQVAEGIRRKRLVGGPR